MASLAKRILGFTGTREGMTAEQRATVDQICVHFDEVHHGDCDGADKDMHEIARLNGKFIVCHPPVSDYLRAFCEADVTLPQKEYLPRDRDIVDVCDLLVGTPFDAVEKFKGGTWYTLHYAEKIGKPSIIVWPNGLITRRNSKVQ